MGEWPPGRCPDVANVTRAEAAGLLGRVLRGGAYSNVVLARHPAGVDRERHRFVQGLVMHALRTVGLADTVMAGASHRSIDRLDAPVVDVLRIAIAELDRGGTPPPVVVSEAVEAARASGSSRASGFVNGVLREVVRAGLPELTVTSRWGVPDWLSQQVMAAWGQDEADRFWRASMAPARVGLRGMPPEGADVTPVPGIPGASLADRPVPGMVVQDPASTAVVLALEPGRGDRVLDLAGAPGGKTAMMVESVGVAGRVVAGDLHARRLRTARGRVPDAAWLRLDATRAPFDADIFDAVLLDAPCSGLGSLRRRPEIVQRVTEQGVGRLAAVQRKALHEALRLVRPGGRAVYSVCTVLRQETVDQVDGLGARSSAIGPGRPEGDGWLLAPHLGPTDGMFVAVFDR